MIAILFFILLAVRVAIVGLASLVAMLNVNDIVRHVQAHTDVPFWPIAWILLALSAVIGSNTFSVNKK